MIVIDPNWEIQRKNRDDYERKKRELLDYKIQNEKLSLMKDYIRMGMSDSEISKLLRIPEEQIYNYKSSFKK